MAASDFTLPLGQRRLYLLGTLDVLVHSLRSMAPSLSNPTYLSQRIVSFISSITIHPRLVSGSGPALTHTATFSQLSSMHPAISIVFANYAYDIGGGDFFVAFGTVALGTIGFILSIMALFAVRIMPSVKPSSPDIRRSRHLPPRSTTNHGRRANHDLVSRKGRSTNPFFRRRPSHKTRIRTLRHLRRSFVSVRFNQNNDMDQRKPSSPKGNHLSERVSFSFKRERRWLWIASPFVIRARCRNWKPKPIPKRKSSFSLSAFGSPALLFPLALSITKKLPALGAQLFGYGKQSEDRSRRASVENDEDDEPPPMPGAHSPTGDAWKHTNNARQPTNNSTEPARNASGPTDKASGPTDNTSKPADNASKPTDNTSKPADNASTPMDNASTPTDSASKPTENAAKRCDDADARQQKSLRLLLQTVANQARDICHAEIISTWKKKITKGGPSQNAMGPRPSYKKSKISFTNPWSSSRSSSFSSCDTSPPLSPLTPDLVTSEARVRPKTVHFKPFGRHDSSNSKESPSSPSSSPSASPLSKLFSARKSARASPNKPPRVTMACDAEMDAIPEVDESVRPGRPLQRDPSSRRSKRDRRSSSRAPRFGKSKAGSEGRYPPEHLAKQLDQRLSALKRQQEKLDSQIKETTSLMHVASGSESTVKHA